MSRAYPPAPWHLVGHGMQTVHLVEIDSVRDLIPSELSIVSVLPGKTVGVIAFAHYGPGSVIPYNELIVAPALVRYQRRIGVWITHIYVDDDTSMQGGRELWGVPKQRADFTWNDDGKVGEVSAAMNGHQLCRACVSHRWWLMRKKMNFPTFSRREGDLIRFVGETTGRIGWGRGTIEIPSESPFHRIRIGKPKLSLWIQDMTLICGVPQRVGKTSLDLEPNSFLPEPLPAAYAEEGSNL